jgi:tRNA threonylcarbamoyladenosine biosynthesis protein TsaB
LVLDSATVACSVALFDEAELITADFRLLGRGHAEALVPMIAAFPGRGKADRIAVALGPGSFTGVRVGLAAARGLALAWGSALVGYPTLALIAAMARDKIGAVRIAVVTTGGHGEWFVQTFGEEGTAETPLVSLSPEAALAVLDADVIAGNQAQAAVALRGHGEAIVLDPDARSFTSLPADTLTTKVEPLYGRLPDAQPSAPRPL